MNKYKNKEGIELNFTGNDSTSVLVKEVVREALKLLTMYDRNCKISINMAIGNTKKFLTTNFNLTDDDK